LFAGDRLQQTQHTPHLEALPKTWQNFLPVFKGFPWKDSCPELWVASVVPAQTQLWLQYPNSNLVRLADVPLQNLYPTFGLDRAIALCGAGMTYGWPTLVLDGGTALTLTGADAEATFIGGAILPGLGLQLRSLHEGTAGLPLTELPAQLPEQWAKDTTGPKSIPPARLCSPGAMPQPLTITLGNLHPNPNGLIVRRWISTLRLRGSVPCVKKGI
jgi:type III pantothenate kinase